MLWPFLGKSAKFLCFYHFNFRAMYIIACVRLGFVSIGKLEI